MGVERRDKGSALFHIIIMYYTYIRNEDCFRSIGTVLHDTFNGRPLPTSE